MVEVSRKAYRSETWIFAATAASVSVLFVFPRLLRGRTEGVLHPHGYCYIWDPVLVWAHVAADALIGAAYVAISLTLGYFVYRVRHLLPFHWMFLAFGLFILTCGATHFMEVWTLWFADFWASAALKIVTAVASVATAVALPPLIPQAVRLLQDAKVAEERRIQLMAVEHQRQAMEEESRVRDLFLATLSHEMRTPLNAMLGWTKFLSSTFPTDAHWRKPVDAIHRNAMLQVRLVEDMLDVSAIVAGRMQLEKAPFDLVDVVRHAVEAARPLAVAREVQIECHLPECPISIDGDAVRLEQVVWNLLSNAIKFSDAGARITVALRRDGPHAVLSVVDTGIGIDAAMLPRIFENFVQADQSSTRSRGGLGLGLPIVRHLVERHGGTVEARSEGLGRGARFEVRLPA